MGVVLYPQRILGTPNFGGSTDEYPPLWGVAGLATPPSWGVARMRSCVNSLAAIYPQMGVVWGVAKRSLGQCLFLGEFSQKKTKMSFFLGISKFRREAPRFFFGIFFGKIQFSEK